jgi:hypothetical protein
MISDDRWAAPATVRWDGLTEQKADWVPHKMTAGDCSVNRQLSPSHYHQRLYLPKGHRSDCSLRRANPIFSFQKRRIMDIHLNGIHSNVRPRASVSYGISRHPWRAPITAG